MEWIDINKEQPNENVLVRALNSCYKQSIGYVKYSRRYNAYICTSNDDAVLNKVTHWMLHEIVPEFGKWISINDKLPEDGQKVLTYKNGLYEVQTYESKRNGWINHNNWFWSLSSVTHWMLLPENP